jgi:PAS domain S-box-containing protein
MEQLRQQAEKIIQKKARKVPGNLDALLPADAKRMLHDLHVQQIELELQNDELRGAQVDLEASRARYFDLYDMAPVGYFTLDTNGLILQANLTGAIQLGVARGALVNQPLGRFVAADDADKFYLIRRQLLSTGSPQAFELRLSRNDDTPFVAWMEAAIAPDVAGAPAWRVVVSDITERTAVQDRLRYSQSLLQIAGKLARVGGWAIKLPQNDLLWSDEICAILDFPSGTVPLLAEALSLYSPESRAVISSALKSCARDGVPFDFEAEIFTSKRRRLDVRVTGQAVRDESGTITAIEGAFQDITERKEAEQVTASLDAQLRESQKMEAIGTLAGGIAHDFNNIIGTILGNVELARQDAASNWQALVSLEEIRKAGHRARDLVEQILSFSRRQPTSRRVISLPSVVEESVRLLRATLPGGVGIDCHCAVDTLSVMADPTQVQQVLLNLGTNAAHAMDGRAGHIDIRVEAITLSEASAPIDPSLRPGRYARVVVSDTGQGMDAATRRRIFDPFFTTKPVGKGTGLGLTVAHGIMQAHEGAIVVHSEPGTGSRFELYFPRAGEAAAVLGASEKTDATGEGRGQHILYIDDDEAQLFLIKRMLERWGYRVSAYLEQGEARDALLAGERFDMVVTDLNMPGISGLEVALAIRAARPDVPVIVVSGYITDMLRTQAEAAGVRELISKPHEVEELRDAVQRHLATRNTLKRAVDP